MLGCEGVRVLGFRVEGRRVSLSTTNSAYRSLGSVLLLGSSGFGVKVSGSFMESGE